MANDNHLLSVILYHVTMLNNKYYSYLLIGYILLEKQSRDFLYKALHS